MQRIISGIQIKRDLLGRHPVRVEEQGRGSVRNFVCERA
jgi:hypothetical protein